MSRPTQAGSWAVRRGSAIDAFRAKHRPVKIGAPRAQPVRGRARRRFRLWRRTQTAIDRERIEALCEKPGILMRIAGRNQAGQQVGIGEALFLENCGIGA
jgi:hypothetical protein